MALNSIGIGFLFTAKDLASGTIGKLERNFTGLSRKTDEGTKRVTENFKQFGAGLGVFGAGVAGLAVLGKTTALADEFGTSIAEVSTLVDEAAFPTEKMIGLTKEMAAEFGGPITAQARGLYQAISAGATSAEAASETMRVSNKLATAGIAELDDVVKALAAITKSYAADGVTAAEASDKLFTTVRLGITDVRQLSSTLANVVPTAATAGVSFDEVSAALATLTGAGIPTSEAVTRLNAAILALNAPTQRQIKRAKELGIELGGNMLKTKGLAGSIMELAQNTKLSETDLRRLLGSQEALIAVQVLGRTQSEKFAEATSEMGKAAGATDVALKKIQASVENTRKRLQGLVQGFIETIGRGLNPLRLALFRIGEVVFKVFTAIPEPVIQFAVQLAAVAAAATAVFGAVVAAKAGIALLLPVMKTLPIVGALITGSFGPLILVFGKVILAIGAVIAVIKLLSFLWRRDFMGIRSIGLIVWDSLKAMFEGFREGFKEWKEAAQPAIDGLKEALKGLADALGLTALRSTIAGGSAPTEAFKMFGKWVGWLTTQILPPFIRKLQGMIQVIRIVTLPIQHMIRAVVALARALGGLSGALEHFKAGNYGLAFQTLKDTTTGSLQAFRQPMGALVTGGEAPAVPAGAPARAAPAVAATRAARGATPEDIERAARRAMEGRPIVVQSVIDGEVVGETVAKAQGRRRVRYFGHPVPETP